MRREENDITNADYPAKEAVLWCAVTCDTHRRCL